MAGRRAWAVAAYLGARLSAEAAGELLGLGADEMRRYAALMRDTGADASILESAWASEREKDAALARLRGRAEELSAEKEGGR